jgi:hypothetical protein
VIDPYYQYISDNEDNHNFIFITDEEQGVCENYILNELGEILQTEQGNLLQYEY